MEVIQSMKQRLGSPYQPLSASWMRTIVVLLMLGMLPGSPMAQPAYTWAKRMGGPAAEAGWGIAVDGSNNVLVSGIFEGTVDFDPGTGTFNMTSSGYNDVFVTKQDSSGNLLWAKRFGGVNEERNYSITVDALGNSYLTGYFGATVDFDPGPAVYNLTSIGPRDIFVVKLDAAGNLVWAKAMGNGNIENTGTGITLDPSGNLLMTGSFQGAMDFDPGPGTATLSGSGNMNPFILKWDPNGNFIWAKQIGNSNYGYGADIATDAQGNLVVVGQFNGSGDFDPGPGVHTLTTAGDYDAFIIKLSSVGNFIWAFNLGNSGYEACRSVSIDTGGNILAIGTFAGTVDFQPGTGVTNVTAAGSFDAFLLKLSPAASLVWANRIGGTDTDYGHGIVTDVHGNVFATGLFDLTADMDPGPATHNLVSHGIDDAFLLKWNAQGNYIWSAGFGGSDEDRGNELVLDQSGNVLFTGHFQFTTDFNPGSGTNNLTASGGMDIFVAKYQRCIPNGHTITPTACDSYTAPDGQVYSSSGTYYAYYLNAAGCDSIISIQLTIHPSTAGSLTLSACDSMQVNGISYDSTGVYVQQLTNAAGCDSVLTINLSISQTPVASVSVNGDTLVAQPAGAQYQWIDCQNGLAPIGGATMQTFMPLASGSYAVVVTAGGCMDTSACAAVTVIGVRDGMEDVSLGPNPTYGILEVSCLTCDRVAVYDMQGQIHMDLPMDSHRLTLDLSHLPDGVYLLRLRSESSVATRRIVVVR